MKINENKFGSVKTNTYLSGMKNYNEVRELADEFGVNTSETTIGMNGYPMGLELAITDFDTITSLNDAMDILNNKYPLSDIRVVELTRKDGQALWNRGDTTASVGKYSVIGDRDWAITFDPDTESAEQVAFEVVCEGRDLFDYETLQLMANICESFKDDISRYTENVIIFYDPNNNYKIDYVVGDESTGYSFDTRTVKLGIIIDFNEEDLVVSN